MIRLARYLIAVSLNESYAFCSLQGIARMYCIGRRFEPYGGGCSFNGIEEATEGGTYTGKLHRHETEGVMEG
jgi:hypothetical protein